MIKKKLPKKLSIFISKRSRRIDSGHKMLVNLAVLAVATFIVILPILVKAASLGRGYVSKDDQLAIGMAASLTAAQTGPIEQIERATFKTQDSFVGIVTTKTNNSVVISSKEADVYVTTEGQTKALVTDVAGEIKKGDYLSLSPLRGYLMKANGSELKSVGIALEDFSKANSVKLNISDIYNQPKEVRVASIGIEVRPANFVDVTYNKRPLLTNFARSLTGKEVSQWQVALALVIFFVLLVTIGSVVYSAVHSTIEALGRNPLAKADIYKEFIQVLVISIIILSFGGLMIFALLWL